MLSSQEVFCCHSFLSGHREPCRGGFSPSLSLPQFVSLRSPREPLAPFLGTVRYSPPFLSPFCGAYGPAEAKAPQGLLSLPVSDCEHCGHVRVLGINFSGTRTVSHKPRGDKGTLAFRMPKVPSHVTLALITYPCFFVCFGGVGCFFGGVCFCLRHIFSVIFGTQI